MKSIRLIAPMAVAVCLLVAPLASGKGGQTSKAKGGNVAEQIKALHEQGRQAALKGDECLHLAAVLSIGAEVERHAWVPSGKRIQWPPHPGANNREMGLLHLGAVLSIGESL